MKQNRSCWLFAGFRPERQTVPLGQSLSCSQRWVQTQYGAPTRHWQEFGDSQSFWRIADANRAMDPLELETPGRTLRIPMPQPGDAGLQP